MNPNQYLGAQPAQKTRDEYARDFAIGSGGGGLKRLGHLDTASAPYSTMTYAAGTLLGQK